MLQLVATLIGEGTGKQQESVTSSYRLIFFTVKRACIPRATHCLYWAIASAGVNGRGLGLVTLAQVKAVCEGKQAEGQCCVNITPLAVLAEGGTVREGMQCWGKCGCWVWTCRLNWPVTSLGEVGGQG